MTTWAELTEGDKVLDKDGNTWTVRAVPELNDRHHCEVAITNGEQYVSLTRPRKDDAPLVEIDPLVKDIVDNVVSIETAREASVRTGLPPRLYVNADQMGGLALRSHLYLLHGYTPVTKMSDVDAMVIEHEKLTAEGSQSYEHLHEYDEREELDRELEEEQ